jgi:TetR/AcrR family transcriptional regulator
VNDCRPSLASADEIPPDERADRIIAAALAAFAESGFTETRLSDVALRADVSTATLLEYFPSKEEVFREVVRSTLIASLMVRDDEVVPFDSCAVDAVRALARRYLSAMVRPELAAIVRLIVGELPRFPELAVFHASEALERFARMLERSIEVGVSRGELRPVDVRAAARTILAALSAHALWLAHPAIYAGVTGSDREHAVTTTIESLIQMLGPVPLSEMPPAA